MQYNNFIYFVFFSVWGGAGLSLVSAGVRKKRLWWKPWKVYIHNIHNIYIVCVCMCVCMYIVQPGRWKTRWGCTWMRARPSLCCYCVANVLLNLEGGKRVRGGVVRGWGRGQACPPARTQKTKNTKHKGFSGWSGSCAVMYVPYVYVCVIVHIYV